MPVTTHKPPARLPQLDVLRAVAIGLVLLCHNNELIRPAGRLEGLAGFLLTFGWVGVDLFFVLSGFLIGGLLFKEIRREGRLDAGRFLVRRAFKIWPGYFALVGYVAYRQIRHGQAPLDVLATYWPNLLQVQNYFANIRPVTWSLAVEEHFYLALPLLLLWLCRGGTARVERLFLPVACLIIGLVALDRSVVGLLVRPGSQAVYYFPTHMRIDALLFGVCLAYVAAYRPATWAWLLGRRAVLLVAGLALISPAAWLDRDASLFMHTVGYTMLYLGFGCLLVAIMGVTLGVGVAGRLLASPVGRALGFVGFYSYGIYLWHYDLAIQPVSFHLRGLLDRFTPEAGWALGVVLYTLAAVVAGMVATHLIELPMLYLRERVMPARRGGPVPADSPLTVVPAADLPVAVPPRGPARPFVAASTETSTADFPQVSQPL